MRNHHATGQLASLALVFLSVAPAAHSLQTKPSGAQRARIVTALSVQERATQEAELAAAELEEVALSLEALAKDAKAKALEARGKATLARRRANEARKTLATMRPAEGPKSINRAPGSLLRGAQERENAKKGQGDPAGVARILSESNKHAAAKRTAEQNKTFYARAKRAAHEAGPPKTVRDDSMTFGPGEAPDIGDMTIRAKWQWSLNVARGSATFAGAKPGELQKTGNVDLARLCICPSPNSSIPGEMSWGMRRYNLGDSTVVDCDFVDIPKEHGIYDNLAGHGLYMGNVFENLGGQAIQIAHRDKPYQQYKADNLPFYGRPVLILDDNHASDTGKHASRSGFTWTFFDYGNHQHPSTIVLRNCTSVQAWDFSRTVNGEAVPATHRDAIRSPGGLVLQMYQQSKGSKQGQQTTYACETFAIDNCLFDYTQGRNPIAAIRGVGTVLIEDSCFIARNHRGPFIDIDDKPGMPSGKIILENCVSPKGAEVFLRIRGKQLRSMHCPGQRLEIDVRTLAVTESEVRDDPVTRTVSPLIDRVVVSGITPQPEGHVDDLGLAAVKAAKQKN